MNSNNSYCALILLFISQLPFIELLKNKYDLIHMWFTNFYVYFNPGSQLLTKEEFLGSFVASLEVVSNKISDLHQKCQDHNDTISWDCLRASKSLTTSLTLNGISFYAGWVNAFDMLSYMKSKKITNTNYYLGMLHIIVVITFFIISYILTIRLGGWQEGVSHIIYRVLYDLIYHPRK